MSKSNNKMVYKKYKFTSFENGISDNLNDDSLPIKYPHKVYNFSCKDGKLTDGIGINEPLIKFLPNNYEYLKTFKTPAGLSVLGCWYFSYWNSNLQRYESFLIIYCDDNKMYYNYYHTTTDDFTDMSNITFTQKPVVMSYKINGLDTLIMVTENEGMYAWNINHWAKKINDAPKISSMCVQFGRLFVTTSGDKRSLWYSTDLDPTNFNVNASDGGYLEMIDGFGRLNKVIAFESNVLVIRDYNIAKISAYANQTQFGVSQLYVSNGLINHNTVCVCGNKLMFLATDGLYEFSGNTAKKLDYAFNQSLADIDNTDAVAGFSNGYYYLSCRIKFDDNQKIGCENGSHTNNACIKINIHTGKFDILRGCDILDICVINDTYASNIFAIVNKSYVKYLGMFDMSGEYFENSIHKSWTSPKIDFGKPHSEKLIKEFFIETKTDCTVHFNTDKDTKVLEFEGKEGEQMEKLLLKCKELSVEIITDSSGVDISNMYLNVGVYD